MDRVEALATAFQSDQVVTIALEDGGLFKIQKATLTNAANYFKHALEGSFAESKSNTLILPGCDTPTFKLFLCWLCDRALPAIRRGDAMADDDDHYNVEEVDIKLRNFEINLTSLWVLANYLSMPRLQNAAMRKIEDIIGKTGPEIESVKIAFTGTASGSKLRYYMAHKVANLWYQDEYDDEGKDQIGCIPGFMRSFAALFEDCALDCRHGTHCSPWYEEGDVEEYYMVPEIEQI